MQIKHLSSGLLQPFGEILPQCPPQDCRHTKTRLEILSAPQIDCVSYDTPVVLDYVSGMSVLAVFQETTASLFYLDRVVELYPGTIFALFPMEGQCCVDLLTSTQSAPVTIHSVNLSSLENTPKGLEFEKIYTFLYQECTHNFYFRGEKHLPYELVYVDHGELHNLVRGQDIVLKQQQFMIIARNDWHTQFSDLAVSFLTLSFGASNDALSSVTNQPFSLTPQLKSIFKKLLAQVPGEPYSSDYTESLLKILLIELLQKKRLEASAPLSTAGGSENAIVDRAIQLISENIHRKLSLDELAALVHVSVPYLYMLFQANLGTSPGKYIAKIRMEECKVLLRSGELAMGQIAETMGFSSLQHFSRQFRSICGMTPTQYVRSLR